MQFIKFMTILEWFPVIMLNIMIYVIKAMFIITSLIIVLLFILSFTNKIQIKKILLNIFIIINIIALITFLIFYFINNIYIYNLMKIDIKKIGED